MAPLMEPRRVLASGAAKAEALETRMVQVTGAATAEALETRSVRSMEPEIL